LEEEDLGMQRKEVKKSKFNRARHTIYDEQE